MACVWNVLEALVRCGLDAVAALKPGQPLDGLLPRGCKAVAWAYAANPPLGASRARTDNPPTTAAGSCIAATMRTSEQRE